MDGVLGVQVGIFQIQPVVVRFRQCIVDRRIQKIECAARGGQLHVGIDLIVCFLLNFIEQIRIVSKIVKGQTALL